MRTLGVEIKGSDSIIILLEGSRKICKRLPLARNKLQLPTAGAGEIENLLLLRGIFKQLFHDAKVEQVAFIRADKTAHPTRVKVEVILQLAAHEAQIAAESVPIQTINAAMKTRVIRETGSSLSALIGVIDPAYVEKAAYCAWTQLK